MGSSISTPAPGIGSPQSGGGVAPGAQPQFVEEPANYVFNYTIPGSTLVQNISVNIDRDSDFMLTGINGSSTSPLFSLNFQLPSGRLICSSPIASANFLGTPNIPTVIGPSPVYRAGSIGPAVTLQDTSGSSNTVQIVFSGIRRLRTA
jgi:hypothetical protein